MNFKVAVLQMRSISRDMERNTKTVIEKLKESAREHADILLLPECFLTGYELPVLKEEVLTEDSPYLKEICFAAKTYGTGVVATAFTWGEEKPRNTAFAINKKGEILMKYDKVHTCDFADEAALESGSKFKVCDFHGVKLGIMICYDREYPESARVLMMKGAEIILVPNDCCSMKPRVQALSTRAYENMTGVVMANPNGTNAGCSCAFSPVCWDENGECVDNLIFMADDKTEGLYFAEFDLKALREYREHEKMGNTYRKVKAYAELTEKKYGLVYEAHEEPFYEKIKRWKPVFTEVKERSFCFDPDDQYNLLLEGDNLHSLKLLEQTHKESIDAIYVDFPYNTESKGFKYRDEYIDRSDRFRHSKWLSFVAERIRIAAGLLKKDGCMMMSINENELFVLKLLCDEIFGEDNYLTTLTVKVRHEDRILKGDKDFHEVTEFLLFYRKSPAFKIKKRQQDNTGFQDYNLKITELTEHPKEEIMDGKRVQIFEPGQYTIEKIEGCAEGLKKISVRGSLKEGNSSGRFFMRHLNERMQTEQGFLYKVENMGLDALGYRYFRIPEAAERRINGDYYQGVPTNRSDVKYVPYPNYVDFEEAFNYVGYEGGVEFRNGKKPCAFLKHCLNLAGIYEKKDALILDFFAGSASTGEAVEQMNAEDGGNRHFILCTNNEVGPQKEEEFRKRIGKTPKEFAEYLKHPDERWEEFVKENGICASIAYPRLKNVANGYTYALQRRKVKIEGIPFNLRYYKADFVRKEGGK